MKKKKNFLQKKNFYYRYYGQFYFDFFVFFDHNYSWFFSDSQIAVLAYHPIQYENFSIEMFIFQVNLILSLEFTLVLSVLALPDTTKEITCFLKINNINLFDEIHFNLEFEAINEKICVYKDILDIIRTLSIS